MSETEKTGPVCKVCGGPISGSGSKCEACREENGLIRSLWAGLLPSLVFLVAVLPSKGVNEWVGPFLWLSFLMIPVAGILASRGVQGFGRRFVVFVFCSGGYILLNFMLCFAICAVKQPKGFGG